MSDFRVTGSGQYRVTGSGEMRVVNGLGAMLGATALAFTLSATLVGRVHAEGSTATQFTTAGALTSKGPLAGTTAATFDVPPADISYIADFAGSTSVAFSVPPATLVARGGLVPDPIALGFTASAEPRGVAPIVGTTDAAFTTGATLTAAGYMSADVAVNWLPSAVYLVAGGYIVGTADMGFTTSADILGRTSLSGSTNFGFNANGTLVGRRYVTGSTTATFALAPATLTPKTPIDGNTSAAFTLSAPTLSGRTALVGSTSAMFSATGALSRRVRMQASPVSMWFTSNAAFLRSRKAIIASPVAVQFSLLNTTLVATRPARLHTLWVEVYRTKQAILDALIEKNRTDIEANATATQALTTRVTATENTVSAQADSITSLQAAVSTKTSTFAQATAPPSTGRVTGDTWIDIDDGNKLYTWNAGWQIRQLDAGISVFAQPTAPTSTGRKVGDLWYDTDDGNRPYRWDGFNWAAIDDARVLNTATAVQTLTTRVDTQDDQLTNIEAKWNITLDVNGYISGVESINNGSQATFTVRADVFRIISPGAAALTPFEVRGGTTYIKDAAIERLTIGKLTTGTLNADMQMGTGKIIYDNGVVMMVQGLGFGSTNQFLEWFGPRQTTGGVIDLTKCTEANAKSYKKTNGDEYMGGTLSVGVLKNGAQSTQVSTNATVETGQFGSNGGARTVNYSLNYYNIGNSNTNAGAGPTSVVVTLQRSVNGGMWTTLTSFTATGAKTAEWDAELGFYAVEVTCGGSATYTDNSGGTGPINYRLVMSSPSGAWPWTNQGGSPGTQSLSVQSIEG